MSDLYVKKRDTSLTISSVKTNTSAKDILATSLNAVSLPSSSSSSSTVKKLQVTIPQEQVHNIKTNVGRLTVCKRTVIKSETSNSLISHLKIVKNNRFTKRSIFDNHNHSSLSITQKINEQIKPLNSNQFVKCEDGKWVKLTETSQNQIPLTNPPPSNEYQTPSQLPLKHGHTQVSHQNMQSSHTQHSEQSLINSHHQDKSSTSSNVNKNYSSHKDHQKRSVLSDSPEHHRNHSRISQQNIQHPQPDEERVNQEADQDEAVEEEGDEGEEEYLQSNQRHEDEYSEQFKEEVEKDQHFIVAVRNLPKKFTKEDIQQLIQIENQHILEVCLEEGDVYDCLIYLKNEDSQFRVIRILDNKRIGGQILKADPAIFEDTNNNNTSRNNQNSKQQMSKEHDSYYLQHENHQNKSNSQARYQRKHHGLEKSSSNLTDCNVSSNQKKSVPSEKSAELQNIRPNVRHIHNNTSFTNKTDNSACLPNDNKGQHLENEHKVKYQHMRGVQRGELKENSMYSDRIDQESEEHRSRNVQRNVKQNNSVNRNNDYSVREQNNNNNNNSEDDLQQQGDNGQREKHYSDDEQRDNYSASSSQENYRNNQRQRHQTGRKISQINVIRKNNDVSQIKEQQGESRVRSNNQRKDDLYDDTSKRNWGDQNKRNETNIRSETNGRSEINGSRSRDINRNNKDNYQNNNDVVKSNNNVHRNHNNYENNKDMNQFSRNIYSDSYTQSTSHPDKGRQQSNSNSYSIHRDVHNHLQKR